jgi:subtilase family serine protease
MILNRLQRACGVLVGMSLGVFAAAPGVPTATAAVVHFHPLINSHILGAGLTFPPDTNYCLAHFGLHCYQPAQFQTAYDLRPLYRDGFDGRGRTIVIVDSFGSPTIEHDLKVFDQTFGLPDPPSFKIIQPAGPVPPYSTTAFGGDMIGWAVETTLDVEWSHVIAPGANILLVATPTDEVEGITGFPEMVAAENYVIDHNLGDVISQSFGATEETFANPGQILGLRSAFKNARRHHVTVLAASGDAGSTDLLSDTSCCYPFQVNSWPSADPLVTSVGGTMLTLDLQGNRLAPDQVWNDAFGAGGGGPSHVFARPEFQDDVAKVVGSRRGTPDISMSGACDGFVVFYSTMAGLSPGYHLVCGTSESSPLFAGIVAIADQMAGKRLGYLNDTLYELLNEEHSGIVDVTIGNNTLTFCQSACGTPTELDVTVPGFAAVPGYDMASGVGTIDANVFVRALAEKEHQGGGGGSGDGGTN